MLCFWDTETCSGVGKEYTAVMSRPTDMVKYVLFKTVCCCLYTAKLWWSFAQSRPTMKKLHVAHINVFRMIMQLPR